MKKIEIFQKGIQPIVVHDIDDMDIESYTVEISNLLKSDNVCILETSTKNVVLRPQYVYSILISEDSESNTEQTNTNNEPDEDVIMG